MEPGDPLPDDEEAALAVIRREFMRHLIETRSMLAAARAANDLETVRAIAHRVAGTAAPLGFADLGAAAQSLDESLCSRAAADAGGRALVARFASLIDAAIASSDDRTPPAVA
jgi:HPt (histidine-containing phosphotransfer) domain-containing protein